MENRVFVIVVSYNGLRWYDRCLGSLQSSEIPLNVVVVDNASTDGSVGVIRQRFPDVVILPQERNLGFGQANNLGMRYALDHGADCVFLLNQDAWIEPDTLKHLVRIHQDHPEYGILSPLHLIADKKHIEPLLLQRLADYRTTDPMFVNDLCFGSLKEVYDTKYVNAAAWLLPRKTLETIGGFDPFFFMYGEDDNYINRVQYHGMKIGICPKTSIVHDARQERPLYDSREHEVLMMIDYTDVNKNHDIQCEIRRHWRKAVIGFLRGRRTASRNHWADYKWLKRYKETIRRSVETNRTQSLNWL